MRAVFAPAVMPERRPQARLLVLGDTAEFSSLAELPRQLARGDVLVVNDAATLPASLMGTHVESGGAIELRLVAAQDAATGVWQALLFGAGDWRTKTEERSSPPAVAVGDSLQFADCFAALVEDVDEHTPRLLRMRLPVTGIYCAGKPVQYAYHRRELALWDHQTIFASRPVAVEPPSSAMHFTWNLVFSLQRRGVEVVRLTHATGISSSGDAAIDARLPFPERYRIPPATARAINAARKAGRRVIAVGTGAMRALESAALGDGTLPAAGAEDVTALRITAAHERCIVSGLVTGMHDEGASHLELLASLVEPAKLAEAYREAAAKGFLWHEYGDLTLILARPKATES